MMSRAWAVSELNGKPSQELAGSIIASEPQQTVVYGAFKGMGDLLSAAPAISSLLNAGHMVKLLIFPNKSLLELLELIEFGPGRRNLQVVQLPTSGRLGEFRRYFLEMARIHPDLIWISPHAPREASSWRIPLLLWTTKALLWRRATLAGARSERLSRLFNERVPVDRDLPMVEREHAAFSMLDDFAIGQLQPLNFVESISRERFAPPKYDLLIHPGANAANRSWPAEHFAAVVEKIPHQYRLAVLGLPAEIKGMRRVLPQDRGIEFLSGTLEQALIAIARARVVLALDSGAAHFAQFLNVPGVAIFGKSDPETIIGTKGSVVPIYEKKFACQPCGKVECNQPEVYCMNTITPETVAQAVCNLLAPSERAI